MFARVLASIACITAATAYTFWITDIFSEQLANGFPIGMLFIYLPTILFLFAGLIMAINPDWHKAEF